MLLLQPVEPVRLLALPLLHQRETPAGMLLPRGLGLAARFQTLQTKLPDRLQHPKPGLAIAALLPPQEALIHQGSEEIEGRGR